MVNKKTVIFVTISLFFLLFSFYPTIFELSKASKLADPQREFVLEHNYYWPDYNLYLSKIKQGLEGRLTALEKYTSEKHRGSLIQEFYVGLGWLGRVINLTPNSAYLLGRIIFAPLLLLVIIFLVRYYFKPFIWQVLAFLITVTSASFPRIFTDSTSTTHVGRFMEWWSNIDALQRITFIPHILFGQVVSFYLLFQITNNKQKITNKKLLLYVLLGNAAGITFPPSLITLNTVLFLVLIVKFIKQSQIPISKTGLNPANERFSLGGDTTWQEKRNLKRLSVSEKFGIQIAVFLLLTLPSLLYIFLITRELPWSALVDFHRTHPMMIPFDQYILGTGPVFFLGIIGAVISVIKREKRFQPLIFWILSTFAFAAFFSVVRDQSPLRFTQTGLFIPLGLLGTYFFYQLFHLSDLSYLSDLGRSQLKAAFIIILSLYLLGNLYMMKVSLEWQTTWISQKVGANVPPVPYPPQSMYPIGAWMDGIRYLADNTNQNDVVLAEITAANYIPAYSGNTVYFGQSNTVDYDRKERETDKFFKGQMTPTQAELFLKNGRIKYIFFSLQEKEKTGGKTLETFYPDLKPTVINNLVTVYRNDYNQ